MRTGVRIDQIETAVAYFVKRYFIEVNPVDTKIVPNTLTQANWWETGQLPPVHGFDFCSIQ